MAYSNDEFGRDMGAIRNSQASSAASLKTIEFTNAASAVANTFTMFNTARAARSAAEQVTLQQEQLALQQEQHALQQAMGEQTARHEFSMWRQTPEGAAFVDWQQRAIVLIPMLRHRERSWRAAWSQAIGRARAEVPAGEQRRVAQQPARLRQTALKVLSIIAFALAVLPLLGLGMAAISSSFDDGRQQQYEACLRNVSEILTRAECEAIKPGNPFVGPIVWLVILIGLGVLCTVLRVLRRRSARTDRRLAEESSARAAHWGFDPLHTQGAWYDWHESDAFRGYTDRVEHMVRNGATTRPMPSQLIQLGVPVPRQPGDHLPVEVNDFLDAVQRENAALTD